MDKVKVEVRLRDRIDPDTGEFIVPGVIGDLDDAMLDADWSKDPGTGRAIIMEDGSEVLNPVPMAPPLGYKKEESIIDMVARQVKAHYEMLRGDDVIEQEGEALYGEDEDFFPSSIYEVVQMEDTAPDIRHADVSAEAPEPDVDVKPPVVPEAAAKVKKKAVAPSEDDA